VELYYLLSEKVGDVRFGRDLLGLYLLWDMMKEGTT